MKLIDTRFKLERDKVQPRHLRQKHKKTVMANVLYCFKRDYTFITLLCQLSTQFRVPKVVIRNIKTFCHLVLKLLKAAIKQHISKTRTQIHGRKRGSMPLLQRQQTCTVLNDFMKLLGTIIRLWSILLCIAC